MSIIDINNMPFGLGVQKGLVTNFSGVQKFGLNTAVGTSFETIWDGNNTYTYPSSSGTATATLSEMINKFRYKKKRKKSGKKKKKKKST